NADVQEKSGMDPPPSTAVCLKTGLMKIRLQRKCFPVFRIKHRRSSRDKPRHRRVVKPKMNISPHLSRQYMPQYLYYTLFCEIQQLSAMIFLPGSTHGNNLIAERLPPFFLSFHRFLSACFLSGCLFL